MLKWINKKRNQKGFTLIELVVVIAILGVLAALAIPRIAGFKDTATAQVNKQTASQIKSAVAMAIASGEIKVESTESKFEITSTKSDTDNTWTATFGEPSGTVTPSTGAGIKSIIENYVEEIRIEPLKSGTQKIIVTMDDGGGVQAEVTNVPK